MNSLDSQPLPATPLNQPLAPKPRSRFWTVTLQVVITWVLYILSIGPMYWTWFGGKYANGSFVVAAIYEPLLQLGEFIPPLGRFLNWYVSLWLV